MKPRVNIKIITIKKRSEVHRHLDNIKSILRNSNATPIRCRGSIGYMCCYCDNQYPEATDLKRHTAAAHPDKTKSSFLNNQTMRAYVVKLDITLLRCSICDENIKDLDALIEHLTANHDQKFHSDIKSHIMPFKFDSDNPGSLKCAICFNEFNNFKVLAEHMNVHYRNHVCEVCGCGFVNLRTLQAHSYRHKTGVFNCSFCSKVFNTRVKQKDHERAVHVCMNKRYKCGYCGEKFTDYTKKNDHEVKSHGTRALVLRCHACDKTFDNQRALTVHTKAYHMMERRMSK